MERSLAQILLSPVGNSRELVKIYCRVLIYILLASVKDLRYTVQKDLIAELRNVPGRYLYKRSAYMASKTDTEVIIGGKVFTLSGYESEEYLQKVASYINNKLNEYSKVDSFRRQPLDTQGVLMQLNIADDFFKAKKQISVLEEELQTKEKELYDLKHELISTQIKLESSQEQVKNLQQERSVDAKKIVQLETELKEFKKK